MDTIPCKYWYTPEGFTIGDATVAALQAAGFHRNADPGEDKPGQQPLSEMLVSGSQMLTPDVAAQVMRNALFRVLRDPDGSIVATWDEGRWWTPDESEAFTALLVAQYRREEQ